MANREDIDFRVVKVEDDNEQGIDEVQGEDNAGEDPCCGAGKQECIASTGVVQQETQRLAV